ncbi:MAG: AEC family transporter [Clostridia bacterium]|nr:AEC family transporter [Clostridia bacterium]
MSVFLPTLNQMGYLFSLIIIGFVLVKYKIVPENSATVLSKLENTLFVPCLMLGTFAGNFTPERLSVYGIAVLAGFVLGFVMLPLAIFLPKLLSKDEFTRNVYTYGIEFANFGFMGNAVVSAVFPEIFTEYLIFTIPLYIMIYMWAVPYLLIPSKEKGGIISSLKNLANPMFVGVIIGMLLGIFCIKLPPFLDSVITISGNCMSPIAMLLTGMTVALSDMKKMFKNAGVYFLSFIRLVVIPLVFIGIFSILPPVIPRSVVLCTVCCVSMPLGLNTVVVPSAYGKDTSVAAGMAIVSHLLSCLTIPVVFMIITNVL